METYVGRRFYWSALLIAFFLFVAASCSSSEENNLEIPNGETVSKEYLDINREVFNHVLNYMQNSETSLSPEAVISYAKGLSDVEKIKDDKGFITVTTTGGVEFYLDMNVRDMSVPEDVDIDVLADDFNSQLEEQGCPLLGSMMSTFDEMNDYLSDDRQISSSRATKNGNRILTRKNILAWCPWPQHRNMVDAKLSRISKIGNTDFTCEYLDFSSDSFKEWSKYDMVYVVTHGSPNGHLSVPLDILDEQYGAEMLKKQAGVGAIGVVINGKLHYLACGFIDSSVIEANLESLDNTIVWIYACYSGEDNSAIRKVISKKNAADFIGVKGLASSEYVITPFVRFYVNLRLGCSTAQSFYNGSLERAFSYVCDKKNYTFTLHRYGGNNVSYSQALITGLKSKDRLTDSRTNYNRQNEKCNFEKRKVHFSVFSGLFGRGCLTAVQTLFNQLKNSLFYGKIIPQTFCGLRDFYYLCIVILAAFTPNLRPFS